MRLRAFKDLRQLQGVRQISLVREAGPQQARHPDLAEAGNALLATLLPIATRIAHDDQAAFDLLLRISSAAHGLAVFLRQGLFGIVPDALNETADRASRAARALIADTTS